MKLFKVSIIMLIISLAIKVSGLFREIIIGNYFGVSVQLDQFVIASLIPIILASSLASSINVIGVKYLSQRNYDDNAISSLFNNVSLISGFLLIIVNVCSAVLYGLNFLDLKLYFLFTILMPSMVFFIYNGLFKSILHHNNSFYLSNLVALPYNATIILFVILSRNSDYQIYFLAFGTTLGVFLQTFLLYSGAKRFRLLNNLEFRIRNNGIQSFLGLFPFVILGSVILPLNLVIDRLFSSSFGEGSVSLINYANNIIAIPLGLIITNIFAVYFPLLSKLVHKKKYKVINKIINKFLKYMILLTILLILVAPFMNIIIEILFNRGEFESEDINKLSKVIIGYFPLIVGMCVYEVVSRIYYLEERKIGIYLMILLITSLNVILSIILSNLFKIYSIPLSTGISFTVISLFYLYKIKGRANKVVKSK